MSLRERLGAFLWQKSTNFPQPSHDIEEARRFIQSPESLMTPLSEFERRFGIKDTDSGDGNYYRTMDPEEIQCNRTITDNFLKSN